MRGKHCVRWPLCKLHVVADAGDGMTYTNSLSREEKLANQRDGWGAESTGSAGAPRASFPL